MGLPGNEVEGLNDKCEKDKGDAEVDCIKEHDWNNVKTIIEAQTNLKGKQFFDEVDLEDNI